MNNLEFVVERQLSLIENMMKRIEELEKKANSNNSSESIIIKDIPLSSEIDGMSNIEKKLLSIEPKTKDKDNNKDNKKDKKDKKDKSDVPPIVVTVSYKINCISDISSLMGTFAIDMKLFFKWSDTTLIGRDKKLPIEECDLSIDPNICLVNDHEIEEVQRKLVLSDPDTGQVKLTLQIKGTCFIKKMMLNTFPWDCQNLQIILQPYKLDYKKIILVSDPNESVMSDHNSFEWSILSHCQVPVLSDPKDSSTNKIYSGLEITVLVSRQSQWYNNNIFIPLFFLLIISLLSYGIEDIAERNNLAMNCLLASCTTKYIAGDQLPKVNYRTLVDWYIDCCFFIELWIVGGNIIVMISQNKDSNCTSSFIDNVNYLFLYLSCLFALLFHLWLFIVLSLHYDDISSWTDSATDIVNSNKDINLLSNKTVDIVSVINDTTKIVKPKNQKGSLLIFLTILYLKFKFLLKYYGYLEEDDKKNHFVKIISSDDEQKIKLQEIIKKLYMSEREIFLRKENETLKNVNNISDEKFQSILLEHGDEIGPTVMGGKTLHTIHPIDSNNKLNKKEYLNLVRLKNVEEIFALKIQRAYRLKKSRELKNK